MTVIAEMKKITYFETYFKSLFDGFLTLLKKNAKAGSSFGAEKLRELKVEHLTLTSFFGMLWHLYSINLSDQSKFFYTPFIFLTISDSNLTVCNTFGSFVVIFI